MSMKNVTTLKGVFPQPRPPPKRDFIRENRLKIRKDQKCASQRRICSEMDEYCPTNLQYRNEDRARMLPSIRINSGCSCESKKSLKTTISTKRKVRREPLICDKAVQTDDITDEAYLAYALSRITTNEQQRDMCHKIHNIHLNENVRKAKGTQCLSTIDENNFAVDFSQSNDDNRLSETEELILREPAGKNFNRLNSDDKAQNIISHRSDTRTVRIPKYLEREKREKELQRIREMEKDPHCPEGHSILSDDDRKAALNVAENKFRDLVDELNRMPMGGETLRTRNRKMEIEKSLMDLENTIRKFSKTKVYVKTDN